MQNCQNLATKQEIKELVRRSELSPFWELSNYVFGFVGPTVNSIPPALRGLDSNYQRIRADVLALNNRVDFLFLDRDIIVREYLRLHEKQQASISQLRAYIDTTKLILKSDIERARDEAKQATETANKATETANEALKKANKAVTDANKAIEGVKKLQENLNNTIREINKNTQKQNEINQENNEKLKKIIAQINAVISEINKNTQRQSQENVRTDSRLKKLENDIDIKQIRREIQKTENLIDSNNLAIKQTNAEIARTNEQINKNKQELELLERAYRTNNDLNGLTRKQLEYQNTRLDALGQTQVRSAAQVSQVEQQQTFISRAVGGGGAAAERVKQELSTQLEKAIDGFTKSTATSLRKLTVDANNLEQKLDQKNLGRISDIDLRARETEIKVREGLDNLRREIGVSTDTSKIEQDKLKLEQDKLKESVSNLNEEKKENQRKINELSRQISLGLSRIKILEDKPDISEAERAELTNIKALLGEKTTQLENLRESDQIIKIQIANLKESQKEQEKQISLEIKTQQQVNQQKIVSLQGNQQTQQTQIQILDRNIRNNDLKQTSLNDKLKIDIIKGVDLVNENQVLKIDQKLGLIGAGLATLTTTLNPNALNTQIQKATCQTLSSPGCSMPLSRNIANQVGNNLNGINAAGISAANAQLAAQAGKIAEILARLAEMQSFLTDKFGKLWKHLGESRLWQIINFLLNLHNAIMLSRNLAVTLTETANTVLQAIGIKDPEGNAIDVGAVLGTNFNGFMEGLVGAENWTGFKTNWAKANRIIAAATQLKDNILGLGNVIQETQEVIGSWVAKIGNGLKEDGLISDSNYDWMDESPQFRNHFTRFNNIMNDLTEATESVNQLASQVVETQELLTEIDSNWDTLKTELNTNSAAKGTEETNKSNESSVTVAIENNDLIQAVGE